MNGLNFPQICKKKKIFLHLEKQICDLIHLQESRIRQKDQLIQKKIGNLYAASAQNKKKGVTIYAKPSLNPKLLEADTNGRWI